ncbi:MAG: hypothetical protein HY097_04510 [Nitrospinae bacterium]|nr:hypothetical protein [Nitrospinota bacterium]MBI3815551.1 hypothetical protein [Nitrospinota bacterium]
MNYLSIEKVGGVSLILGSLLLTVYAALFPILLPIGDGTYDYVQVVLNPNWIRLAIVAFVGVLSMLVGFYAVYSRLRSNAGLVGAIGFLFVEAAYVLQACKVTWELFLYPIIASHPESAFLLREAVIKHDPAVVIFRIAAAITIFIGIVLFCLTLYRSDEYPKRGAILIFVGALVYAIGPMVSVFVSVAGIFILSIGCLLIGVRLFRV